MIQRSKLNKSLALLLLPFLLAACNLPAKGNQPEADVPEASAITWHVTTYLDTFDYECSANDCSLRDAVYQANEAEVPITIYLPGGLYVLNNMANGGIEDDTAIYGDLDVFGDITIVGDGIDFSNISGGNKDRIFHIFYGGQLELRDMSILNGSASDFSWEEEWSWPYCTTHPFEVSVANAAQDDDYPEIDCVWSPTGSISLEGYERKVEEKGGGAIANRGDLRLKDVSVAFSTADRGGGIKNKGGRFVMEGGFLCNNTAEMGGAIYNVSGTVELYQVGVCGNEASEKGSAIYAIPSVQPQFGGGEVYLVNVTAGENIAPDDGGVFNISNTDTTLVNVTINSNNSIGIVVESGQLSILNTILVGNGSQNCDGAVITLGHNLETGNSCQLDPSLDDLIGQPPLLAALSELGGLYPLLPDSPAIDAGDIAGCPLIDQQGEERPAGLGCDMGADEFLVFVDSTATPGEPAAVEPANELAPLPTSTPLRQTAVEPANELAPPPTSRPTDAPATSFIAQPPATNTPTDEPPPTNTATIAPPSNTPIPPDPMNASISGTSWNDNNGNGSMNPGEGGLPQTSVKLGAGACSSTGLASTITSFTGTYSLTGLAAGTYCVSATRAGDIASPTTSSNITVVLSAGQSVVVDFGFQEIID